MATGSLGIPFNSFPVAAEQDAGYSVHVPAQPVDVFLSILSQLPLAETEDERAKAPLLAFNSFPVAAVDEVWGLRRGKLHLSILSQLPLNEGIYLLAEIPSISFNSFPVAADRPRHQVPDPQLRVFQFFPSCRPPRRQSTRRGS